MEEEKKAVEEAKTQPDNNRAVALVDGSLASVVMLLILQEQGHLLTAVHIVGELRNQEAQRRSRALRHVCADREITLAYVDMTSYQKVVMEARGVVKEEVDEETETPEPLNIVVPFTVQLNIAEAIGKELGTDKVFTAGAEQPLSELITLAKERGLQLDKTWCPWKEEVAAYNAKIGAEMSAGDNTTPETPANA